MKTLWVSAIFVMLLAGPAFSDSMYFLLGYNFPHGGSDVYTQNERETSFHVSDLNGWSGSAGYDHFLNEHFSIGGSISGYSQHTSIQDNSFVHLDNSPIFRTVHLEIVPTELNLHALPVGRNVPVIPYLGGGVGIYYWQYSESGDFVMNRNSPNPYVVHGYAYSDGWDPGWHAEAGVQIPVSRYATIMAEYRYFHAHGKLDVHSFDPAFGPLDLSSSQVSMGVSFWF